MASIRCFSFDYYRYLINKLKQQCVFLDYGDIDQNTFSFLIIRHDVEFSVERAYNMAIVEKDDLDITTSYFFQLNSNAYNILSPKNTEMIQSIHNMGHKIGLHIFVNQTDISKIPQYIKTMENHLDIPIDQFSYHKPNGPLLLLNHKIKSKINAYDSKYFQYYEGTRPDNLNVTYISDSNHKWKYGHPLSIIDNNIQKVQLLIHPYSWTKVGYDNFNNFNCLLHEKRNNTIECLRDVKNFPEDVL